MGYKLSPPEVSMLRQLEQECQMRNYKEQNHRWYVCPLSYSIKCKEPAVFLTARVNPDLTVGQFNGGRLELHDMECIKPIKGQVDIIAYYYNSS